MTTLKAPRIPLSATSPKLPFSKPLVLPSNESNQLSYYGKSQAADLIFDNEADSGAPSSKSDSGKSPTQSPIFKDNYVDPRLATFDRNVETMRNNLKAGIAEAKANAGTNTKVASVFLKPTEQKRIKDLLLFADGGEEGAASGDYRYNPKTGKVEPRVKMETALPGVSKENSDAVDIIVGMPDDFDFEGWDSKSAKQQQQELEKAGLNRVDQMTLLNSKTSLETLAIIKDISNNRHNYGLSVLDVERISKELLQISSARVGANNHDIPFLTSPATRNTFLSLLDEKEQKLLSSFGYGVKGLRDKNNPYADIGNQVSDLLSGDDSIPAILHGGSDVIQVAGEFFDGMTKLGTLIENIENGNVSFNSPAEKQRYLDYLTSAYDKNESLYRQQLASKIDDAKLLQFPETRFKELINDLSLSQLEGFVEQINEKGVRKLSRPGNFEKLMKDLLSDQTSALNLVADDTKSPIRPYVWNGMDIVNKEGVGISGYYFDKGQYHIFVTCVSDDGDGYEIDLGRTLPSKVDVEVSSATEWDMFGEQLGLLAKLYLTPSVIVDSAYSLSQYYGVPAFLPEGLSPSDLPVLGEILDEIDFLDHNTHLTKDTITLKFVTHYPNSSDTNLQMIQFNTIKYSSEG